MRLHRDQKSNLREIYAEIKLVSDDTNTAGPRQRVPGVCLANICLAMILAHAKTVDAPVPTAIQMTPS